MVSNGGDDASIVNSLNDSLESASEIAEGDPLEVVNHRSSKMSPLYQTSSGVKKSKHLYNRAITMANTEILGIDHKFSDGDSFGELELLYSLPRSVTIHAAQDSVVWVLGKEPFMDVIMGVSRQKIDEYMGYIQSMDCFKLLFAYERRELAQALIGVRFIQGELVAKQGDTFEACHLVISGEVAIVKDGVVKERILVTSDKPEMEKSNVASASDGGCCCGFMKGRASRSRNTKRTVKAPLVFGQEVFVNDEICDASVEICSEQATALMLSRDTLELAIGSLAYLQKTRSKNRLAAVLRRIMIARQFAGTFTKKARPRADMIYMKDLTLVTRLGCGGFGVVEMHRHKTSGKEYALKRIDKGLVSELDARSAILNEKQVMMGLYSSFTIQLFETYNTPRSLCFLLELAPGGELDTVIHRRGLYGSEKHAKYYAAGIICAFEYLHHKRILYRDLKTENVLLDIKGRPKLGDFGLAKYTVGRTYTFCGTPEYLAPEVVQMLGHVHSVDWWTLGIFIFELMEGKTPFASPNPQDIFGKIVKNKPKWPKWASKAVGDLIRSLLQVDPADRLPVRPGGVQNIAGHPWYSTQKKFDWEAFRQGELAAPWVPKIKKNKEFDAVNFNTIIQDTQEYEYKDDGSGWDANFATVPTERVQFRTAVSSVSMQ
jgi:protein kinase A